MNGCWSPWYYYDNVKSGSYAVAATSIFFSSFCICYISYCLDGGESSQFFLPLFETDVRNTMKIAGGFMLGWYIVNIIFSILMIRGVNKYHRGMILPWLSQNLLYILLLIAYAIWLQASYYHFLLSVIWFIIWLFFAGIHIYMHRCVKSQYDIIKEMYAPNIILLDDPAYYY